MTEPTPYQGIKQQLQDGDAGQPLYARVMQCLQDAVEAGDIARGSFLPSERDLSQLLSVSRVTLRRAIDELVSTGVLVRKHGAKTLVAPRYEKAIANLTGFSEDTRARGQEPGALWISKQVVAPTSSEAIALKLSLDDKVVRLRRLRTADSKPLAIEVATVPLSILPSPDLVQASLYDALDALHAHPEYGVQRLRADVMNKEDARLLDCEPGAPLLVMERCCFLPDGRPVEFTQTRYNGESYEFVTQLKR